MDTGIIIIALLVHLHSVLQHRNTTAMIKHHAKVRQESGVRHNMREVVGALIHARLIHAIKPIYGTARLKLNVKE